MSGMSWGGLVVVGVGLTALMLLLLGLVLFVTDELEDDDR